MKRILFIFLIGVMVISIAYNFISPVENSQVLPYKKDIVDYHIHVAGLGHGDSGCFINKSMRDNFRFNIYLKAMGTSIEELETHGDQIVFSKISTAIAQSKTISHGIILALDGVMTDGQLDQEKTQVYVPNHYVYQQTKKYKNLRYAASINPYRSDAVARLEKAKQQGAVFIKWIPSIMYIDPADQTLIPFYKKMVELNMPLLTHTGMEKSFENAKDELADPLRLTLPLGLGVKVIAAHIATTGESEGEDNFQRILPLFKQYPNLYADISSLTQINKHGFMPKAIAATELKGRLIYGTDWPLQFFPLVSAWLHLDKISLAEAKTISRLPNQWDRDVALKHSMGLNKDVFYQGAQLFEDFAEN